MQSGNFWMWLAWAVFGSGLVLLLWRVYLPRVLAAPDLVEAPSPADPSVRPAWLYCEEGTALDRRAQWFPLRPVGRNIIGRLPRASTPEFAYLYLTADDLLEDHVQVRYNPEVRRFEVETLGAGAVLHNNERVPPGQAAALAEGDTLDLGRISRFRFTLVGPEDAPVDAV